MYSKFEGLMKEHRYKISDVQKGTGIPYSTFTDWKAGRYTPKRDKLQKIADFFHVPLDYLTGESNKEVYSITDFEYMIICEYRKLPIHKQEAILDILHIYMDVAEEKNVSSGA